LSFRRNGKTLTLDLGGSWDVMGLELCRH
jgi:hypothetical protein